MNENPINLTEARVDVLLPIRLPAPWLDETLAGLSKQTFRNWRLIAICHGDKEELDSRIRGFIPDSTVLSASTSKSLPEILNFGLSHCTSKYVARIDSDDIPNPNRLERQVEFLELNPSIIVLATGVEFIDSDSSFVRPAKVPSSEQELIKGMRWKCVIHHPSVMYRRAEILRLGGYASQAKHCEDYDLWLRILATGRIAIQVDSLTKYRLHDNQVTRTRSIPKTAFKQLRNSKVSLARSRGESVLAALVRHQVWVARQRFRPRSETRP